MIRGLRLTGFGETHAVVPGVLQVPALGETFDHPGDGSRLHAEGLSQRAR